MLAYEASRRMTGLPARDGRRVLEKLTERATDRRRIAGRRDSVGEAALAQDPGRVALVIGQREDRPPGSDILVQLGGDSGRPAGAVHQEEDIRLGHGAQRLSVGHLTSDGDDVVKTAGADLGFEVRLL